MFMIAILSKALVALKVLIKKLEFCGIIETALSYLRSNLENNREKVAIENAEVIRQNMKL